MSTNPDQDSMDKGGSNGEERLKNAEVQGSSVSSLGTPAVSEEAGHGKEPRVILCAIDDSARSEESFQWLMKNMYKEGDVIHLVHVIPRFAMANAFGGPALDLAPFVDPESYQMLIDSTKRFISSRFSKYSKNISPTPVVHICKADQDPDSVGAQICRLASSLHANFVIMAKHQRSQLHNLLMGSVSRFCVENCKRPVVLVS